MRVLPDIASLGKMRSQRSVLLTIAGVAFMEHCATLLAPLRLTPSRAIALAYIEAHPGADQASLGRAMGMNRGSTMLLVDKLEQAGLVERGPGPDRRSNALQLSPKGIRIFEQALEIDEVALSSKLGWMREEDWSVLSRVVCSIIDGPAAIHANAPVTESASGSHESIHSLDVSLNSDGEPQTESKIL